MIEYQNVHVFYPILYKFSPAIHKNGASLEIKTN